MPADTRVLRRTLGWLYAGRAAIAVAWAITLTAAPVSAAGAAVTALLSGYPAIDAAATLIDLRAQPHGAAAGARIANIVASAITSAAVLVVAATRPGGIWAVYGGWAVVTGGIQLFVGVRRRQILPGQWLMVISGAGSVVAGLGFLSWTGPPTRALGLLTQYAFGGALWYAVTGLLLGVATFNGIRRLPASDHG